MILFQKFNIFEQINEIILAMRSFLSIIASILFLYFLSSQKVEEQPKKVIIKREAKIIKPDSLKIDSLKTTTL